MPAMVSQKRKLSQAQSGDSSTSVSSTKLQKAFFKNASSWDLEKDYENRQRRDNKKRKKESTRLPIKTADGRVQHAEVPDDVSVEGDEDWLEGVKGADAEVQDQDEDVKVDGPVKSEQEQILEAQEELAKIASGLNEDPEEHAGAFKALAKIGESSVVAVQKLALATQMAVYRDVIPGYRIRPLPQDTMQEKVSKDVKRVRQYEQALVAGYQAYIKKLAQFARLPPPRTRKERQQSLSSVAIACACTLLTSVPHFNFRSDLVKIVVGRLSRRKPDPDFVKCRTTLETLFHNDEEGRPSHEVVSNLSKMMRAKEYEVDETVVNLFLHLRLLSEFSGKGSHDHVEQPHSKIPKKKRDFRTKKERKAMKEQKALEKDMATTDALVTHEEKERMQSETLKLVFATYFRILKARLPHLMGAVLEGLAKYAHLINQDFFGDLLEALKDLIRDADAEENGEVKDEEGENGPKENGEEEKKVDDDDDDEAPSRNISREALLCTITAYALLAGQDAHNSRTDLHLDLSFFNSHLYKSLLSLSTRPDLELTSRSNPHLTKSNKVNLQTTTVLLVRCLTSVLLPPWNIRSVPPLRLASFTKQLMTSSLHMPEKSTRAVVALLADVADTHGKKVSGLWNTELRIGNGTFNPLTDFEGSNPFASTVWEGEILRRHFSPMVREGVKLVEKTMSQN